MNKKILFILIIANAIHASESVPVKMHVSQECFLSNTDPFREAYENSIFKITVEDVTPLGKNGAVKEMSLWGDGKIYPVKSNQEQINNESSKTPKETNDALSADELRAVSNAKFVKLLVKYEDSVKEEQSSNGISPYFATIKTTVAKEQYLPVILNRSQIDTALLECTKTFDKEKNRQSLYEILIGIGLLAGLIGITVIVIRLRRSFKK